MGKTFLLAAVIVINVIIFARSLAQDAKILTIADGGLAHFNCSSSNNTSISWKKGDKELEDRSQGVAIISGCRGMESHLLVAVTGDKERGTYTCVLGNSEQRKFVIMGQETKIETVDYIAIGVSLTIAAFFSVAILFFLLRARKRKREDLLRQTSRVSVNAQANPATEDDDTSL